MTPSTASPSRSQFLATVAANVPLCRDHFRLVLSLERFPATEPGQFVQVACRDWKEDECAEFEWQPGAAVDIAGRDLQSPVAMLRRPFSLAGRRDLAGHVELDLIHRVVGS